MTGRTEEPFDADVAACTLCDVKLASDSMAGIVSLRGRPAHLACAKAFAQAHIELADWWQRAVQT